MTRRSPLEDIRHYEDPSPELRTPFQDISNAYGVQPYKKTSMFTKLKNDITQEKHAFKDCSHPRHPNSGSQDTKPQRQLLNRTDQHYDSQKDLGMSLSKFGYEDILKERNLYKRQNIRLQSQLRMATDQNRQLSTEVCLLKQSQRQHVEQLSRKNKQSRAVEDFYQILHRQNDRLQQRNQELQLMNSNYLREISGIKDLSSKMDWLEDLNRQLLQQVRHLALQ